MMTRVANMETWCPNWFDKSILLSSQIGPSRAFSGFVALRMNYGLIVAHSGVIFAGILIYEALRITDCIDDSADGSGHCGSEDDDGNNNDDNENNCGRLWGLIKPGSLLTVIGTAANVFLALTSAFIGAAMDFTPYRRQFSMLGTSLCVFGTTMCVSIIRPNETTILLCSIGYFITNISATMQVIATESYEPELSQNPSHVSTAVSLGAGWFYLTEISSTVMFLIVGFFVPAHLYGFVATLGFCAMMLFLMPIAYNNLPNVPAARNIPLGETFFSYSFTRLRVLATELRTSYPDLGLLIMSYMIFDPAMQAIFGAAVLVMEGRYHFTPAEMPIILGCGIAMSVPGVVASRWILPSKGVIKDQAADHSANDGANPNSAREGGSMREELLAGETQSSDDPKTQRISLSDQHEGRDLTDDQGDALHLINPETQAIEIGYARSMLWCTVGGLVALSAVSVAAPLLMQSCNLPLGCMFGAFWGFSLAFTWNSFAMLKTAITPGGSESEIAALFTVSSKLIGWLPLLVFTIAIEVWTIEGALWSLVLFYAVAIFVLCCVNLENAIKAQHKSLSLRRWAV